MHLARQSPPRTRRRRTATVLATALAVALVPLVAAPAAQAAAPVDLGPNTIVFDPSQPIERDPGHGRRHRDAAGPRALRRGPVRAAVQARHVRHARAAAPVRGRLLHRGRRPGPGPRRRRHQRRDRGLQPVPPGARGCAGELPRAGQLLALAVQPDHPVRGRRRRRLPQLRQLLGRLAGRPDAPRERHGRQRQPHGLLHGRPAVRVRRLHRRLDAALRGQRQPAAVPGPQRLGRRLEQQRLEPGVRGRPGRSGHRLQSRGRRAQVHDARHHAGLQGEAVPLPRRRGEVQRLRPVGAEGLRRGHVGDGQHARQVDPDQQVLRRQAR